MDALAIKFKLSRAMKEFINKDLDKDTLRLRQKHLLLKKDMLSKTLGMQAAVRPWLYSIFLGLFSFLVLYLIAKMSTPIY